VSRDALADVEPVLGAPHGSGSTSSDGASAIAPVHPAAQRSALVRVRIALAGVGAALVGAAPHVLHHAGPLAGAALLAGASGKLLFATLGFVAAIPMLRKLRRRTGSWRVPTGVLAVMAVVFAFSSFVLGPAIAGDDDEPAATSTTPSRTFPSPAEHEQHHR
jgi:hypothetical protein